MPTHQQTLLGQRAYEAWSRAVFEKSRSEDGRGFKHSEWGDLSPASQSVWITMAENIAPAAGPGRTLYNLNVVMEAVNRGLDAAAQSGGGVPAGFNNVRMFIQAELLRLEGQSVSEQPQYPFPDGTVLVLGPECFVGSRTACESEGPPREPRDDMTISWKGENFYTLEGAQELLRKQLIEKAKRFIDNFTDSIKE